MKKFILLFILQFGIFISTVPAVFAAAAITLSQAQNGSVTIPTTPVQWVPGNLGSSNAHYTEGMSIPYRALMTGLPIGTRITLTIGYDIMNSSKHAIDYLTQYNRLLPHNFGSHATPETINPLTSSGLASAPFTTYKIPAPSSAGSLVAGQPTTSYNNLTAAEMLMTLYNGTIDTIYYLVQGSLILSSSETQMNIVFHVTASTAVLAWGGHIASRIDWGYINGVPQSAGGISGSPFHMRLKTWSLGSLGNQDRSLSGNAVIVPSGSLPVELVSFRAEPREGKIELFWTTASEVNSNYFCIEKSYDAANFSEGGTVEAAGNSITFLNYEFTDAAPFHPLTYYRLKEMDFDGISYYSAIVAATDKYHHLRRIEVYSLQGTQVRIFENPASGITLDGIAAGLYSLKYYYDEGIVMKKIIIDGHVKTGDIFIGGE